jgi:hypothetical protein
MEKSNRPYVLTMLCAVLVLPPVFLHEWEQSLSRRSLDAVLLYTYIAAGILLVLLVNSYLARWELRKKTRDKIRELSDTLAHMTDVRQYVDQLEDTLREIFCIRYTADSKVPDMRYYPEWRDQFIKVNGGRTELRHRLEQGMSIEVPPSTMSEEALDRYRNSTVQEALNRMRRR